MAGQAPGMDSAIPYRQAVQARSKKEVVSPLDRLMSLLATGGALDMQAAGAMSGRGSVLDLRENRDIAGTPLPYSNATDILPMADSQLMGGDDLDILTKTGESQTRSSSRESEDNTDGSADGVPGNSESELLKLLNVTGKGKKADFDLSPLLALTDSWTGSNLLRGYERPKTQDELDQAATLVSLKANEQIQNKNYKDRYLDYLTKQSETSADLRREGFQTQEAIAANRLAAKGSKGPDKNKLKTQNKGSLAFIAKGKGAKDKLAIAAGIDDVHEHAVRAAEQYSKEADVPFEQAYQDTLATMRTMYAPVGDD